MEAPGSKRKELLHRLGEQDLTPEEASELMRLIPEGSPADMPPSTDAQAEIPGRGARRRVLQDIRQRIKRPRPSLAHRLAWGVATAATVLVLLSVWFWSETERKEPDMITTQTAYGEIKVVTLPDGSTVTLNGNSTLRYAERWPEGDLRIVELGGEAEFAVRRQAGSGARFRVITEDLNVEVLGTVFEVSTYRAKTNVRLREGSVTVDLKEPAGRQVWLAPGEEMSFSANTRQLVPPHASRRREAVPDWKEGYLSFDRTSLSDICSRLAATHGLIYSIPDSATAQRKFTLTLPLTDLDRLMPLLARSTGTKTRREGDTYILQHPDS